MPRNPDHLASTIQRHGSVALKRQSTAESDPFNTDEWEPSRGPFWVHALAGSIAGVAEHSVMFPIDTMKTHAQVLREHQLPVHVGRRHRGLAWQVRGATHFSKSVQKCSKRLQDVKGR